MSTHVGEPGPHDIPHMPVLPEGKEAVIPPTPTHTDVEAQNIHSPASPTSPTSFRHPNRSSTAYTYRLPGESWKPGQEPGLDVTKSNPGSTFFGTTDGLDAPCEITVVDYSPEHMRRHEHNATTFNEFLKQDREPWVKVRWVNVNGMNWSVIRALGKKCKLHRLSIEDLVTKSRTKVDWYTENTFVLLTLQKLISLNDDRDDVSITSTGTVKQKKNLSWIRRALGLPIKTPQNNLTEKLDQDYPFYDPDSQAHFGSPHKPLSSSIKTLQSYHGGSNLARIAYMESHSMLASKVLAVSVEQVSIFLTSDNTVVSFFERSADDIEPPLLDRLKSSETILRKSSDASMLLQAVLDAIIDLSYHIVVAYQDMAAELELDVLTDPSIKHTSLLYILTSELSMLKSTIQPIATVVKALRDHRNDTMPALPGPQPHTAAGKGSGTHVSISPMTQIYLGDVEDHCASLMEGVETMRRSADNMIDLIFNTLGAYQNESMRQLTLVTLLFLPLTFLTGYFGMNFQYFSAVDKNSDTYFWKIAAPVTAFVLVIIMWNALTRAVKKALQKKSYGRIRRAKFGPLKPKLK
jgi:Mg2+ and Co2+ transporter CorA